ncbi:MAG: phosphotransferase [Verrucomicrobia bacterium]|nr:phosphotransferase [Verrucomicrobiota bacterium]
MSSKVLESLNEAHFSQIISSFAEKYGFLPILNDLKIVPLTGGKSQASLYRFEMGQQNYVLKLLPTSLNERNHQILLATQAGQIGIAPVIHFVDFQLRALIMDFIPGRTVHPQDFKNRQLLVNFAQMLRQLHQSSSSFPVAQTPFQRFHQFLLKGEAQKIIYPKQLSDVKKSMEEIEAVLQQHSVGLTPTHLDLNPLNILLTDKSFFLVDWSNGGLSDPYFDLATFCVFHGLSDEQKHFFLALYLEREPTRLEWSRFVVVQPVRLFVIAAAFLSLSSEGKIQYEKAILLNDFIIQHAERKADLSLRQIGLIMLNDGLDLIAGNDFKQTLSFLKDWH